MGRDNGSPLRAVVKNMPHTPGAEKMLGMSGICSPALAGRVRRGGRLQWFHKFFASQKTYSSKMAWRPFLSSARDRSGILLSGLPGYPLVQEEEKQCQASNLA
jgi:hypothetical protein